MVWLHGSGSVALALALAGCGNFIQAETGTEGDEGSSETGATTHATVSLSTAGGTDSATGGTGTGTAPTTDPSDTTDSDPTGVSATEPSGTESAGATSSSTGLDPTTGDATTAESTGEDTRVAESTGPAECVEADVEPNGDPENGITQSLPDQFCATPASTVSGTLLDGDDLDAFLYFGSWNCGDTNNPNHRVQVDGPVTVCLFPLCPNGIPTDTTCIAGTDAVVNDVPGCCSTDTVIADVNCVGTSNESAFGFLLVESETAECTDYTLTYAVDDA